MNLEVEWAVEVNQCAEAIHRCSANASKAGVQIAEAGDLMCLILAPRWKRPLLRCWFAIGRAVRRRRAKRRAARGMSQ